MPEPTPPPQNSADNAASFAARNESMRLYFITTLEDLSEPVDPEDTYAQLLAQLTAVYQDLLDAAGPPFDEYEPEEDYKPSAESSVDYVTYLQRLVATIPGS